uniref:DUF148 domain-containing protein n=1 Tax=Caenorhabditis tropicalis TaxID=1561998 RepID=A0A1I7UFN8_9PELO
MNFLFTILVISSVAFAAPVLTVSEEMEQIFQNLTTEAQEDYFQVLFNGTATLAELDQMWDEWAEKHGITPQWTAYTAKWQARKDKFKETTLSVIEKLPSAYRMMSEVIENRDQTMQHVQDALDKLREPYYLEVNMILLLSKILMENEEVLMNGGTIEIENEVVEQFRKMRDYKKNGNLKVLLVPGPLV